MKQKSWIHQRISILIFSHTQYLKNNLLDSFSSFGKSSCTSYGFSSFVPIHHTSENTTYNKGNPPVSCIPNSLAKSLHNMIKNAKIWISFESCKCLQCTIYDVQKYSWKGKHVLTEACDINKYIVASTLLGSHIK